MHPYAPTPQEECYTRAGMLERHAEDMQKGACSTAEKEPAGSPTVEHCLPPQSSACLKQVCVAPGTLSTVAVETV
jgi:hypothetical protein